MKNVFEFTLVFKLPDTTAAAESYLNALHQVGCSDATPGVGRTGFIALAFNREAETREAAEESAELDVFTAIPGAVRVE